MAWARKKEVVQGFPRRRGMFLPYDFPCLRLKLHNLKPCEKGFQVAVQEFLPSLLLLQLRFLPVQKTEDQVEVANSVSLSVEM